TAVAQADAQDLARDLFRFRFFTRDARVVEDERVQVAVAGVEDVGDAQAGLRAERGDLAQHGRDVLARDHAVLDVIVRRDAADRGERGLAAFPGQRAFRVVLRGTDLERAGIAQM